MRKLTDIEKEALWLSFDGKCWICERRVEYSEMEIDHLIPKSIFRNTEKLSMILENCGLPNHFDLFGFENLRPAHGRCNRAKSDIISPVIAFEIVRGRSKAKTAIELSKRLSRRSNVSRAIRILKAESIAGPLESDAVEALQRIIAKNLKVIQQHRDLNPKIPNPTARDETVGAFFNLEPLAKLGLAHQLGVYFEAILGLSKGPAAYNACFRGLVRSTSVEENPEKYIFVQNPDFDYRLANNHIELLDPPPNAVLVSYYTRSGDKRSSSLRLEHFEWILADEDQPTLPAHHSERYLERLW